VAIIDRAQLLSDMKLYLPPQNVLSDTELANIGESVITQVGDDEDNYPEVLCKSLRAAAIVNQSKTIVSSSTLESEKVGGISQKLIAGAGENAWPKYIKSLSALCPILGYTGLPSAIGIYINPGDPVIISSCDDEEILTL
jgi:hypothetical protein